jgi:hypothetical protein
MFTKGCLVGYYDCSYALQDPNGKIKLNMRTAVPILEGSRYILYSIFFITKGELDEVSMRFTVKLFVLPRYDLAIGASHSVRLNDYGTKTRVIMGELLKYNNN